MIWETLEAFWGEGIKSCLIKIKDFDKFTWQLEDEDLNSPMK